MNDAFRLVLDFREMARIFGLAQGWHGVYLYISAFLYHLTIVVRKNCFQILHY